MDKEGKEEGLHLILGTKLLVKITSLVSSHLTIKKKLTGVTQYFKN